jgi:antitoxin (DNA-binding transcriptional repressor) of toxin-antitoxin stability system
MSVGEAKSRFSESISRVTAGERFLIRRQSRPVAVLIGSGELDRLERLSLTAHRLAQVLGQDAALLKQIEAEQAHPAMAACQFGRTEAELARMGQRLSDIDLQIASIALAQSDSPDHAQPPAS